MISSFEMRRNSFKLIEQKLKIIDEIEAATDRVIWRKAVERMLFDKHEAEALRAEAWRLEAGE